MLKAKHALHGKHIPGISKPENPKCAMALFRNILSYFAYVFTYAFVYL